MIKSHNLLLCLLIQTSSLTPPSAFLHPRRNTNNNTNQNTKQTPNTLIRNIHKNVRNMKNIPTWRNTTNSTNTTQGTTGNNKQSISTTTIHQVDFTMHDQSSSHQNHHHLSTIIEHDEHILTLENRNILMDSSTTTTISTTRTKKEEEEDVPKKTITFYTYTNPVTNISYHASNTPKSKFISYITYMLNQTIPMECITESELSLQKNESGTKNLLRTLWKQGRLLTNSTEILAFYSRKKKRGGFLDYLTMYVDRFISILQDNTEKNQRMIYDFLVREYGREGVLSLQKENFNRCGKEEQIEILKPFLVWFRERFPYYYDRCDSCGRSVKENPPQDVNTVTSSSCNTMAHANDDSQEQHPPNNSPFLGYIYPSISESTAGKASRTELYHCPYCSHYTRFPRYNAVSQILTMDKGRCGEYSMLLYQFLSSLGFTGKEIRWVVDWSDHVWVEILSSDNEYIHLDPCEAVVDHKLLYHEWGKKQTYIIAFSSPENGNDNLIEDVTICYTSDSWEDILGRRDEGEVGEVVKDMRRYMMDQFNIV